MAKKNEPKEKSTTLDEALKNIEQQYGKGAIMNLGAKGHVDIPSISTGALTLDIALGIGGVPRGRIVEIYGPESSGKTTLCQHIIANSQKSGDRCAFVDVEHALDPSYAARCGVDIDTLLISQPDCGEDALNITEMLVRSNSIGVLVVDSVAALTPRAEIEGQMGDSHVGLQARLMSQALRKITAAVHQSNTCLIFTNQIREKIGVMFGNPETTAGGNALKFYASVRMDIRGKEHIKDSTGEAIGRNTSVKIVKNKLAAPFKKAEFKNIFPNGIDSYGCILEQAVEDDIIEKKGSWFSYGTDQLGQGAMQAAVTLQEDAKLAKEIEDKILAKHNVKR